MSLDVFHALTLRARPLGEHDTVVTLFARERGLLRISLRGARRPKHSWGIAGESLILARWWVAPGRSLDSAKQVEVMETHAPLRLDYERLMLALHMLDALQSTVLDDEPHPQLFDRALGALAAMQLAQQPLLVAAWFEIHLASDVGYRPELEHCVRCTATVPEGACGFDAAEGGIVCPSCQALVRVSRLDGTVRKLLHRLQMVELPAIVDHSLSRELIVTARRVLHASLGSRARFPWNIPADPDGEAWNSSSVGYPMNREVRAAGSSDEQEV